MKSQSITYNMNFGRELGNIFPETDTEISRNHASILYDHSLHEFMVYDLGSGNGTF